MIVSFCNLVTTHEAAFIQWKINRTYIYKGTSYFFNDKLKEKTILRRWRGGDNPEVQTSAELHNDELYLYQKFTKQFNRFKSLDI